MRLCNLYELADPGARGFDPLQSGQDSVVVVRQGQRVHVWADACPHHGTPMAWRKDAYLNAAGDRIVCAAHGALFEIDTGLCTLGPCKGDSLQALPFTTRADGEIHLATAAFQETTE